MSFAIGPRSYGAFVKQPEGQRPSEGQLPISTSFLILRWAWQSSFLSIVFPSEIQRGRVHATPPLVALESTHKQSVAGAICIGTYGSSLRHGRLSQLVTALSIALLNNLCVLRD
jgi:hypothetical protein